MSLRRRRRIHRSDERVSEGFVALGILVNGRGQREQLGVGGSGGAKLHDGSIDGGGQGSLTLGVGVYGSGKCFKCGHNLLMSNVRIFFKQGHASRESGYCMPIFFKEIAQDPGEKFNQFPLGIVIVWPWHCLHTVRVKPDAHK